MDDFKPKNLKKVEDLFIITSTHGEEIHQITLLNYMNTSTDVKRQKLGVRFSVLALEIKPMNSSVKLVKILITVWLN